MAVRNLFKLDIRITHSSKFGKIIVSTLKFLFAEEIVLN